jgi:hypothetical protein
MGYTCTGGYTHILITIAILDTPTPPPPTTTTPTTPSTHLATYPPSFLRATYINGSIWLIGQMSHMDPRNAFLCNRKRSAAPLSISNASTRTHNNHNIHMSQVVDGILKIHDKSKDTNY